MQFIEKNSFNVRSAVYHLKKDGASLEFLLLPMAHVGSKEFYNEVSRRLAACDLILAEGVNSRKGRLLLIDERDRRLITCLKNLYHSKQQDEKIVGVVYGARHMRNAVCFLLGGLNYKVSKAEWITIFDL